ncbi:MAG TPA: SLC45 family MFS transporter [Anaerolineae bacterium]|nr:SLC45 family MFS transporter [Anaerolineae bacterium]
MKLDYKRTFLLGFGFLGISLIWSVYNSYVPIFLREYNLPLWLVGLVMTFDNIAGVTIQPYVGFLSDRTRTRFGRRMPYLMIGAPVAAVFFSLIAVLHVSSPNFTLLMAVIIIMNIAMAIFRTPTVALMPDITPSPLRSKANGIINLMGGLGATLAFLGGAFLYRAGRGLPFYVSAAVMLAATAVVVLIIREPKGWEEETTEQAGVLSTIRAIVKDEEKSGLFILLAIFSWFMGYNALETFWTTYGKESLGIPESTAAAMLTYVSAAFLVFALPAGFIATRFGRRRTILAGLAIMAVFILGGYFTTNMTYLTVMLIIAGIAWALININSFPMVSDIAPAGKIGSYTGLYYFFSMLAAITAPPTVGGLMDIYGHRALFLFSVLFMLLALLCMLQVRRGEAQGTV